MASRASTRASGPGAVSSDPLQERVVSRRSEETTVPRFLFSYRVPKDYQPGAESVRAWEAWFESLGSSRVDTGHGVIATRTLGKLDAGTRLGGYSVVTAEDIDGAAALAQIQAELRALEKERKALLEQIGQRQATLRLRQGELSRARAAAVARRARRRCRL